MRYLCLVLIICFTSCSSDKKNESIVEKQDTSLDQKFDQDKWNTKEKLVYPYRASMLDDVLYNDTIRQLNQVEIINLLGEPDRSQDNHLYYRISQSRLGFWTLKAKTMVVKFKDDETIEWIKVHG